MRNAARLLVVAAVTLVVGALTGDGWPGYVTGAVFGVSLWLMLAVGTMYTSPRRGRVASAHLAGAAAVALVLGGALVGVTGSTASWAVGFVLAGVLWPVAVDGSRAERAGTDRGRPDRGR